MGLKFNPLTGSFDLTGSGGGSSVLEGEVATFADLPQTAGTPPVGSSYLVRESTGVWLVNRRQAGIYIRTNNTGVRADDWSYGGDFPVQSVNGQTGAVTVAAVSHSHQPSAIYCDAADVADTTLSSGEPNGIYFRDGSDNGKAIYKSSQGYAIWWDDGEEEWALGNVPQTAKYYIGTGDTTYPWQATSWALGPQGSGEVPVVDQALLSNFQRNAAQDSVSTRTPKTGNASSTEVVLGSDTRLTNSRTPTSHTHGNLTNAGAIGTTANLPLKTGTNGVVEAGSFGTAAGSFCEGNDARLSDDRDPNLHAASHLPDGADEIFDQDLNTTDPVEFTQVDIYRTETTGQDSALKALSTQDTTSSDANWRGRAMVGADNRTFLMGCYLGEAGLGAHSWTSAATEEGAAWADFLLNPDGPADVYIGCQTWDKDTAIVKISNTSNTVEIAASDDKTKRVSIDVTGVTEDETRVLSVPDKNGTIATTTDNADQFGSGAAADGYVLTSDGAGGAAWEAATGGGGGDTVSIETSAADILSVASGAISADDAGADRIVYWNNTSNKLAYGTPSDVGAAASGSITTSGLTQATARILGRTSASTGSIEEIQIGSGLSLSAGELSATGSGVTAVGASTADVLSVSGSDLVADDPNADRIVFWDDSEGKLRYLEAGSGLTISGTTMTVTATGGATNLWIPASAWIPKTTAGCGVDSRETTTNDQNFDELLFDTGSDELADALVVMPSNYNNGTVTARFYWTAASGSGGVAWGIQGRAFANDDALDTAAGTAQLVTDTLIAANDMHITSATSAVTIGGTPAANTPIQFTIYRDVSDAADTLAVDARLLGVEIIFN
jgi:hypothetical protein